MSDYDSIFAKWSSIFNVPFALIKSIARVESSFNPNAVNPSSGASGLMQIWKPTWDWLTGGTGNIFNPDDNVAAGAKYLSQNLKKTGDLEHTIANYYAGTAYKDESGRWWRYTKDKVTGAKIKTYDVDKYVHDVMGWYSKYSGSSGGSGSDTSPSPQRTVTSGTAPSIGGAGTDIGLLILGGVVGLLFLRKVVKR